MSVEAVEAPHAVTLEQYAGLTAALAENFPRLDVLTLEALDDATWRAADATWKQKLATAGPTAPLFLAYRDKLAVAEDWLARPVDPLDGDLAAWTGFLGIFSTHASPFALLETLGLGMNDLARLQRRWARRMAEDEPLRRKAEELGKKQPKVLPRVRVGTAKLRPFPWSKGRAKPAPAPPPSAVQAALPPVDGELGLDRYAALSAELALAPARGAARVLARYGLSREELMVAEERWKGRIKAEPALERDWRSLYASYHARFSAAAKRAEALEAEAVAAERVEPLPATLSTPEPTFASTSLDLVIPRGLALPFVAGEASPAIAAPSSRAAQKRAATADLGATADAVVLPRGPAMPFAGAEGPVLDALAGTSLALEVPRVPALPFVEGEASPEIRAPSSSKTPKLPAADLGETTDAVEVPRGPGLPFAGAQESARTSSPLGGTSHVVEVPRGPALPFVESAAQPAIATPSRDAAPKQIAADLGGTSLAVEAPRGKALPFAPALDATQPLPDWPVSSLEKTTELGARTMVLPPHIRELMRSGGAPPAPHAPTPPSAPPPPLTIEQYASLCVDLAAAPERTAETLARYQRTAAQRDLVDRHFQERFAREPGLRAQWEHACGTYRAWLQATGR